MSESLETLIEAFAVNPHPVAKFIALSYYRIVEEGLARRFRPYSLADIAPGLFDALMEKNFSKIRTLWMDMTEHMKRAAIIGPVFQLALELETGMEQALREEDAS